MTATPRVLSLCSGYGGLDLAVERVFGARTVAFAEIEEAPAKVFTAHWPDVPNLGDLKLIDWSLWAGLIDIFTAGYPCQPFSLGGKRKGTDDPRHLWPYIAEGIRRVRPRLVVLENVAGHRSMGLDTVLGDLAALGYDAQWTSIRASDIGAPHGRERIFILASDARGEALGLGPGLRASEPVAEPERGGPSVAGFPRPAWADGLGRIADADADRARREGTQPAAGRDLPDRGAPADASGLGWREGRTESAGQLGRPDAAQCGRAHADASDPHDDQSAIAEGTDATSLVSTGPRAGVGDREGRDTAGTAADADDHTAWDGQGSRDAARRGSELAQRDRTPADAGGFGRDGQPSQLRGRRDEAIGQQAGDHAGDGSVAWGRFEPAIRRWERLTRRAPAPTETGPKGGQRLAPRFVEWMMGLPAGWVTAVAGISRNAMLKMLGNGVVPQQAEAALYELADVAGLEVAA